MNDSQLSILELDENLADYEDFEPLPKGQYPAQIVGVADKISSTGNEYWAIQFRISPEHYPADYEVENAPDGTTLTYNRVVKPSSNNRRAITNVKKFMRAIGMPLDTRTIDPNEWLNRTAKVVVGHGTFEGEKRAELKAIEGLDGEDDE